MSMTEYVRRIEVIAATTVQGERLELAHAQLLSHESGWSLVAVYADLNAQREGTFHV